MILWCYRGCWLLRASQEVSSRLHRRGTRGSIADCEDSWKESPCRTNTGRIGKSLFPQAVKQTAKHKKHTLHIHPCILLSLLLLNSVSNSLLYILAFSICAYVCRPCCILCAVVCVHVVTQPASVLLTLHVFTDFLEEAEEPPAPPHWAAQRLFRNLWLTSRPFFPLS